jgi:hypothetical protein
MSETITSKEQFISSKSVISDFEKRRSEAEPKSQVKLDDSEWLSHGGVRLDDARAAVEALDFKSDAMDHVNAKKELQNAEDAWAESYKASSKENALVEPDDLETTDSLSLLNDIVRVGKNGNTFHKPDGTFIKSEHMALIDKHQDEIRGGLDELNALKAGDNKSEDALEDEEGTQSEAAALEGESLLEYEKRHGVEVDEQSVLDTGGLVDVELPGQVLESDDGDDKQLDTSGLDYEKKSVLDKISERTSLLRDRLYTTAGMSTLSIGRLMAGPKPKENESEVDYEKRATKYGRRVLIGALAVVVVTIATKLAFDQIGSSGSPHLADVNPVDHSGTVDSSVAAPSVEVPSVELSPDVITTVPGEGWYQTFKEMGITNSAEWPALLQKVGPKLAEKGAAYMMNNGQWGISSSGPLSSDVLELINNSR